MRAHWALAVIAATTLIGCRRPPEGREDVRDFERMRQQQRYDSYEKSAFFHDGAVLQAPPDHTIPIYSDAADSIRPAAFFTGGDSTAAATIPLNVDATLLARGAKQFAISCEPCHGAGGFGGGVMAPNLTAKRPPALRTPPVSALPPGMMFKVITDGFGRMPPYGWQMPPELRWAVVAYVRTLPAEPATAATIADSTLADRLRRLDSATASKRPLSGLAVPPVDVSP